VGVLIIEVAFAINVVTVRHLWMLNLNIERSAIIYRGVVGCQPIRDGSLAPLGVTGSERELKFTNVGAKKFLLLKPRGDGNFSLVLFGWLHGYANRWWNNDNGNGETNNVGFH